MFTVRKISAPDFDLLIQVMDGWMICGFTSILTAFRDDGGMLIKRVCSVYS